MILKNSLKIKKQNIGNFNFYIRILTFDLPVRYSPKEPAHPCPVCSSLLCFALYPKSTLRLWAIPCPVLTN